MPITEAEGAGAAPVLTTARLRLRPLTRADIPRVVDLAGDPDVALMTATIPYPYPLEAGYAWFDRKVAGGSPPFAIEPHGEPLVGMTGFVSGADDEPVEIGYWLGKPYWGRGYMTEAVGAVVPHAFAAFGVDRIVASVFVGNPASRRVLERCGFTWYGRGTYPTPARGGEREVDIFERLAPGRAADG